MSKLKVSKKCLFLNKLPREIRDIVYEHVVRELREPGEQEGRFTIRTDSKFLPPICSVSSQVSKEALETLVRTNTFIIRSGRAMKYFKRFIEDHELAEFVRSLEFPSFLWFFPGGTFPDNRHGPGGVYSMENMDVMLMQQCTGLQKVRISIDVTGEAYDEEFEEYNVVCHTVEQLLNRYSLEKIVTCSSLQELTLDLTNPLRGATNIKEGGDVFSYAEDLAQLFRTRMEGRTERKVKQQFKKDVKVKALKAKEDAKQAKAEGKPFKEPKPVDEEKMKKDLADAIAKAKLTVVGTTRNDRTR